MTEVSLAKLIIGAVQGRDSTSSYCCQGEVDSGKPTLSINDATPIKLPLGPAALRKLIDASHPAPYGKRTETLVDRRVRDTLEVDGKHVNLTADFQWAVDAAAIEAAASLGLDQDRLRVELYKLLIYPKGGFFAPHRDSEKRRGMVATMIVVLPNKFGGGELVVRHGNKSTRCSFRDASYGNATQYAAFFADCEHEVSKVRSGVRVALAYNLILRPSSPSARRPKTTGESHLTRAFRAWTDHRPSDPIVFALEHQYTASGLKPDLLKGNDLAQYHALAQSAADCDYELHFGQVSRHLCQDAHDGEYGYDRYRRYDHDVDVDDLEIGEAFEDEIRIDGWKDQHGKDANLPNLPCDSSQLISTIPVEDWIPTSQDYEGYTGNAGNTLDRWYHKSAIVLWPRGNSLDVYLQMGVGFAIGHFLQMREGLFDIPEDDEAELEDACEQCLRAAETIIDRWPERRHDTRFVDATREKSLTQFAEELIRFDDPDLVDRSLLMLRDRDHALNIDKLIPAACKRLGAVEMHPILLRYLSADRQANQYGVVFGEGLLPRDASWLAKLCGRKDRGGMTPEQLAELQRAAIDQIQKNITIVEEDRWSRSADHAPMWIDLCKAALATGNADAAEKLFAIADQARRAFGLRKTCVPAAKDLHTWAGKRFDQIPASLSTWIEGLRWRLREATKSEPQPPRDFTRKIVSQCSCRLCSELSAFLSSPTQETTRIAARQDLRTHLENQIRSEQIDVTYKLDRSGSPHALLLTKTTATHARDLDRYHNDLKLLAELEALST